MSERRGKGSHKAPSPAGLFAESAAPAILAPHPPAPHYHGHRDRLRARFQEAGADALPDYELLELLLFRSPERRDAALSKYQSFDRPRV